MNELNFDKRKEQINCLRGKQDPNFGLKSYRDDENTAVKLKACRQLPKALQPKSLRSGSQLFSFDLKARSQPASPVMKSHQHDLLFRRNQLSIDESNWKKAPCCSGVKVYEPSYASNFVENVGDRNKNVVEFTNNVQSNLRVSGTPYRSRRVVQESLYPLLREALRKNEKDYILEDVLANMKIKNDQKLQKFRQTLESSTSGLLFTVNLVKSGGKCLGISLDTSILNGKESVVIEHVFKGSEAMKYFQEGDEVLSINGRSLSSNTLSSIREYLEQLEGSVRIEAYRKL